MLQLHSKRFFSLRAHNTRKILQKTKIKILWPFYTIHLMYDHSCMYLWKLDLCVTFIEISNDYQSSQKIKISLIFSMIDDYDLWMKYRFNENNNFIYNFGELKRKIWFGNEIIVENWMNDGNWCIVFLKPSINTYISWSYIRCIV